MLAPTRFHEVSLPSSPERTEIRPSPHDPPRRIHPFLPLALHQANLRRSPVACAHVSPVLFQGVDPSHTFCDTQEMGLLRFGCTGGREQALQYPPLGGQLLAQERACKSRILAAWLRHYQRNAAQQVRLLGVCRRLR